MAATLGELAVLVGGTVVGDGTVEITGADTLRDAKPGEISFLDNPYKQQRLGVTDASAAVVPAGCQPAEIPVIQVEDVPAAFAKIVTFFKPPRQAVRRGVSPHAVVHQGAQLGQDVEIGPGATIEEDVVLGDRVTIGSGVQVSAGCRIAEDTTIFPGAVLYEGTLVGPRCIIHANAVIGAYGFGYSQSQGRHVLGAQLGHVEIESDVEIGANSTIDRGSYGATLIGEGTKIDNLVMIAHNCRIGKHNLLCSHVGIAGSTSTGDYVVMAGHVGVRDHLQIGTGAMLGAMAGVMRDIPAGSRQLGSPSNPEKQQMQIFATINKLPELRKQLHRLEREVERLSQKKAA